MGIQFGIFVPQGWRMDLQEIADPIEQYEAMTRVARAVDSLPAYDSIWVYDHFHPVPDPVSATVFECWTITAALARDTERVRIGQMVTCNGYRHPALLAKMASTVDVLSHGRLYCGLGAGWYEHEWRAYGYGFPETRDRMGAFREACQIMSRMWLEDRPTFQGGYYSIDQPINEPKGVQKPHPSFWIGGGGEKVTLRLVAEYADACNVMGDTDTLRHKFAVLQDHCHAVNRPYDQIIRSTSLEDIVLLRSGETKEQAIERARSATGVSFVGSSEQLTDHIQSLVEAGVTYVIVSFPRIAYDLEPLYRFAEEVIPQFTVGPA
jgi:F420-dependent oxidoreductase-like protein